MSPGDRLPCACGPAIAPMRLDGCHTYGNKDAIGIIPGPQSDFFDQDVWDRFLSARYRISPQSDRMGLRLEGPALGSRKGYDIVSEGVAPGCVQVPGDGMPIILGRDCQTTGGYPKIATVISADLDRLVQIPTGGEVHFRLVSETDAIEAARRFELWRSGLATAMKTISGQSPDLLSYNLIGGVTKGDDL